MEAETELKYIFSNINEWLKFAEAKHAGLIVFNAGLIIGFMSCYNNIQYVIFKPTLIVGIALLGISILLSLASQFPVTQNLLNSKQQIQNPNLYFFGNLCYLDLDDFINEFKHIDIQFNPSKLDKYLINQILVNARITQAKYVFFKFASYITALGFGLIGFSSFIKIIWHF